MKTIRIRANLVAAAMAAVFSLSSMAGNLSQLPLSLKSGVPPNIMFALSVEWPTGITPAYQDASSYSRDKTYLGYFDDQKCYSYNAGLTSGSVTGWFYPTAYSTNASGSPHACVGNWSGNFLNWVSMAGLDEFRFAMTGGNRVVDLPNSGTNPGGLTVLERSYQTSQGSLFMTKTFTEDGYSTAYGSGATLTFVNSGNGVRMVVTAGGTLAGTATCVGPQLTGSGFNCGGLGSYGYSLSSGNTTNCNTYVGTGTSGNPYTCSAFDNDSGGVPVTSPSGVTNSVLNPTPTTGSVTLSCPANSFTSLPGTCTATLSNGTTGSCSHWTGSGTSGSPYICDSFGTFSGGASFAITMPLSSSASVLASTTDTASVLFPNNNKTCTVSEATSTAPVITTCPSSGDLDGNGTTASCSGYSSSGTGTNKRYSCNSFALSGGTDTWSSASPISPSTNYTTALNGNRYSNVYTINNYVNTATTVYFYSTYSGTYSGTPVYYYSSYNVSLGSGSTTFNVRARVCDPSVGVESDCKQYSDNATWKPTGVLQDNSAAMRFGVTSYFMNSNGVANSGGGISDIDDAVLRSKAKYLGPQMLLLAGGLGVNTAAEWSATDGTFINNPDSADTDTMTTPWGTAPTNSGVVNYINKFGYTSQYYKSYDDVGKLYYETLKYLRGGNLTGSTTTATTRPATTIFYNGAKQANSDGFPIITTWDDPVKYSCQKNYIISMGDTHTWCDKHLPGGTYTSNGSSHCDPYTDGNGNAHLTDMGSLAGDTGISGTINGTAIPAATGIAAATNVVGAMEGMGSIATTQTGAGGGSYYMAGLAAWAATNNIRPDKASNSSPMNVKTFVIDVQENKDCGFDKQFWLAAKYGDPGNYSSGNWSSSASWYNSILGNSFSCASNTPANYGSSTAYMQWPKNLLRAGDPVSMIASVRSAIQSIAASQGDEAALAQSAGTLNTGTGAYIYQASYNSGGWTGDVQSFVVSQSGSINTAADWSASHMLPNPSARNILSFNRTTYAGFSFAPDGSSTLNNFDSYQQGLLNTSDLGVSDGLGVDRVKYIRGDMTNEAYLPSPTGAANTNTLANHLWRSRIAEGSACNYGVAPYTCPTLASYTTGPTGQLGDVVFSNPLYVAAPSAAFHDATYKTFAQNHASRSPLVYVGGNDGMFHAYNAAYYIDSSNLPSRCPKMSGGSLASPQPASCTVGSTTSYSGTEVFGYVPYATYPSLSALMGQNYAHKYYVDGSPVSSDVCISNGGAAYCDGTNDQWMTLLVGSLNAGGKGIYALDITDPVAGFSASNVLWEFTDKDDPDLGYTFSTPIIRKLNNKRWAVIFGNGFNSVDAVGNAGNNKAYLYILYVDPQLSSTQPWVQGTNYFKIALTSPGTPNNASNGLASVAAIDTNQDGMIDYVYGGDRNGNMWKVNVTSSTPASWAPAFSGTPLFSATDGAGHRQQITTSPTIAKSPYGGYMVIFGTGSWIDQSDVNPQNGTLFYTDTLYGIWDQNTGATSSPATGRSILQRQAIIGTYSIDSTGTVCTVGTANCTTYTVQSACLPNFTTTPLAASNQANLCPANIPNVTPATALASPSGTGQQFGWYFDLPSNGERSHSDPPALTGSVVQFTTLTPATNPCTGNTSGFEYNLSYLTGGNLTSGLFSLPGNTSGMISGTLIGLSSAQIALSGKSIVGGAALNPVSFDATPPAAQVPVAPGMPTTTPPPCAAGNCGAANEFVPGWGFLMNLNNGPVSSQGKWIMTCYPQETGGTQKNCEWRHKLGQFGRLSWKQIN